MAASGMNEKTPVEESRAKAGQRIQAEDSAWIV